MALTHSGWNKKVRPWVVPRIVSQNKDYVFKRDSRMNRFSVSFEIGSFTSCVTDAEAAVTDVMDIMVDRLKENIGKGLTANGKERRKREKHRFFYPFSRQVTLEKLAEYEREVLGKPNKYYNKTGGLKKRVMQWRKNYMKYNKWNKGVYLPPPVSSAAQAPSGNWTGLLVDSIQRSKVSIRAKDGITPNKVTCRITVSPNRAEFVAKSKIMSLQTESPIGREINRHIKNCAAKTTIMNAWTNRNKEISSRQMRLAWNKAATKLVKMLIKDLSGV